MKFLMKVNQQIPHGTILIIYNKKDSEFIQSMSNIVLEKKASILVYDDNHNQFNVFISSVYYIENIENKSYIYTKTSVYRSYLRFSSFKKNYSSQGLKQINKTTIVNKEHINSIKIANDCRRLITLDNQEQLVVNRQFKNFME